MLFWLLCTKYWVSKINWRIVCSMNFAFEQISDEQSCLFKNWSVAYINELEITRQSPLRKMLDCCLPVSTGTTEGGLWNQQRSLDQNIKGTPVREWIRQQSKLYYFAVKKDIFGFGVSRRVPWVIVLNDLSCVASMCTFHKMTPAETPSCIVSFVHELFPTAKYFKILQACYLWG